MGIFSQDKTTTNQTAYNQQVAVSNRDLTGSQVTGAAGANTGGLLAVGSGSNATLTINSLDNTALQTAAFTINHALDVNAQFAQSALQGFQNALTVSGEKANAPQGDAQAGPSPPIGGVEKIILILSALTGAVILYGYLKKAR